MPTTIRSFPEVSRQGHQETTWSAAIPATIAFLRLQGVAADAVLSDTANMIDFTISVSPDGTDETAKIINIEPWRGGTHTDHVGNAGLPNILDIAFGPLTAFAGWRCKLAVDVNIVSGVPMVIGGIVTSLP